MINVSASVLIIARFAVRIFVVDIADHQRSRQLPGSLFSIGIKRVWFEKWRVSKNVALTPLELDLSFTY